MKKKKISPKIVTFQKFNKSWRILDINITLDLQEKLKLIKTQQIKSYNLISISLLDFLINNPDNWEIKTYLSRFRDCCSHNHNITFPTYDLTNYGYEELEIC